MEKEMTDSLDDQLEKLILKHEAFDGQASIILSDLVTDIKTLIREREAEARKETKHLVEVNLYTNAIRVASVNDQTVGENNDYYITLQQLEYLMQQAVLAELERRHDG